eukprot:m.84454 g.84454  ORF g.84454 m.84454 type:complete len:936 (+) comp25754_c0_seq1:135-2942(+)
MEYLGHPLLLEQALSSITHTHPKAVRTGSELASDAYHPTKKRIVDTTEEDEIETQEESPDPYTLISTFLRLAGIQESSTKDKDGTKSPSDESTNSPLNHDAVAHSKPKLIALAAKVVAFMGLDIPILENKLSRHEQQVVLASLAESSKNNPCTLGVAQYHRWIVRNCTPARGMEDHEATSIQESKDASAKRLEAVLSFLTQSGASTVPMYAEGATKVPLQAVVAQLNFDIAQYHFDKEDFASAATRLANASRAVNQIEVTSQTSQSYASFTAKELEGYEMACGAACHDNTQFARLTSTSGSSNTPAVIAALCASFPDSPETAFKILLEDSSNPVVPLAVRHHVVDKFLRAAQSNQQSPQTQKIIWQLVAANVVCDTLEGVPPSNTFFQQVAHTNEHDARFVLQVCETVFLAARNRASVSVVSEAAVRVEALFAAVASHLRLSGHETSSWNRVAPTLSQLCGVGVDSNTTTNGGDDVGGTSRRTVWDQLANQEEAHKHVLAKVERLRLGGMRNFRTILDLLNSFEHQEFKSQGGYIEEKIMAICCAAQFGQALEVEIVELDSLLGRVNKPSKWLLDHILAYLLNTRKFESSQMKQLLQKWQHNVDEAAKRTFAFVNVLDRACRALRGSPTNQSQDDKQGSPADQSIALFCGEIVSLVAAGSLSQGRRSRPSVIGWHTVVGVTSLLRRTDHVATLASAITVVHNSVQRDDSTRLSVSRFGLSSALFQPVAKDLVARNSSSLEKQVSTTYCEILQDVLETGLSVDMHNAAFRFALGDLCFVLKNYLGTLQHHLRGLSMVSVSFQQPLPSRFLTDKILERLIASLMDRNSFIQAAALCQHLRKIDYVTAFDALTKASENALRGHHAVFVDVYLVFFWDTAILEMLLHQYAGNPTYETLIRTLLGRQCFNDASDPALRWKAIEMSRQSLLTALANEYSGV